MTREGLPADWEQIGRTLCPGEVGPLWRAFRDRLNREWLRGRLRHRRFAAALKTDAYDEAVGEGVCLLISEIAARFCGMDAAASICRLAMMRYPQAAWVAGDVRRLPFSDGSFDLVVSISTLDHFRTAGEIAIALQRLHSVLRPGGYLLITLDNLGNPLVRFRNALPWKWLNRIRLVPFPVGATLRPGELRDSLRQAGFEIREMTALLHVPRAPAVLAAALLDRIGAPWLNRFFLRACMLLEALARLPTANWTGYYIAAAVKPAHSNGSSTSSS